MQYSILIEHLGPGLPAPHGHLEALAELLEQYAGIVAGTPESRPTECRYSARINVTASSITAAITKATKQVGNAAARVGLEPLTVVHVEASTVAELDRELGIPLYTDTVTTSEIARIFGVSRQRAAKIVETPAFPAPFTTGDRRLWRRADVLSFQRQWERKAGRPASAT